MSHNELMPKATIEEQLQHLPGDILLALATNDSTPDRSKKAAVQIMYLRGDQQVQHSALTSILADVKADVAAHHEVIDAVEQALEQPLSVPEPLIVKPLGASKASVTTETLAGEGTKMHELPVDESKAERSKEG